MRSSGPAWLRPVTLVFLASGFLLIVSGAIVTTSGTHPGADGVPRLYSLLDVTYWHVRIAATFVAALAVFLFLLSRLEQTGRRVPRLAWAVVALTALQIVIGETQWRDELPWYLVWAHVMTATLLWSSTGGARADAAAGRGGQSFQGPQPVTRSGVTRRTNPAGGSSMSGNRRSSPK